MKFIGCTDIPCSEDYATIFVTAWESKSPAQVMNSIFLSQTGMGLGKERWTHGYALLYLEVSLRGIGTTLCGWGE